MTGGQDGDGTTIAKLECEHFPFLLPYQPLLLFLNRFCNRRGDQRQQRAARVSFTGAALGIWALHIVPYSPCKTVLRLALANLAVSSCNIYGTLFATFHSNFPLVHLQCSLPVQSCKGLKDPRATQGKRVLRTPCRYQGHMDRCKLWMTFGLASCHIENRRPRYGLLSCLAVVGIHCESAPAGRSKAASQQPCVGWGACV